MNAPERSTTLTRRQALSGIATIPITVGAIPASAMSFEDVESRIDELASEISDLLPHVALNHRDRRDWYVHIYDNCWCYTRMPWRGHDPILDALEAYREGMEAYWRLPIVNQVHVTDEDLDAAVEATYGPPLAVLDAWDRPALTRAGAVAALKYVQTEVTGLGDGIDAMVKAVLGYLERGSAS